MGDLTLDDAQPLIDEIARRFRLSPGGTLTYRGLWDLDTAERRINFGSVDHGRSHMPVPMLNNINPKAPGADIFAARAILLWLDIKRGGCAR